MLEQNIKKRNSISKPDCTDCLPLFLKGNVRIPRADPRPHEGSTEHTSRSQIVKTGTNELQEGGCQTNADTIQLSLAAGLTLRSLIPSDRPRPPLSHGHLTMNRHLEADQLAINKITQGACDSVTSSCVRTRTMEAMLIVTKACDWPPEIS